MSQEPSIRFLCLARRAHQMECPIPRMTRMPTRMPGISAPDMDQRAIPVLGTATISAASPQPTFTAYRNGEICGRVFSPTSGG